MTRILAPPSDWPTKHLADRELRWLEFDPSALANFVRRLGPDYPGLPERLMECRKGAWRCGSYVQFVETIPRGGAAETAVVWNDRESEEFEEYGIDLDKEGRPLGVELLHRACYDG